MKGVILVCLVALSLAGDLQADKRNTCPQYSCAASLGQACGNIEDNGVVSATACFPAIMTCTNYTNATLSSNGTCQLLPTTPGDPCLEGRCGGNMTCGITNHVCNLPSYPTFFNPGQSCKPGSLERCYNNTYNPVYGTESCPSTGVCPFTPDGQSASKDGFCNFQTSFWNASSTLCTPYSPIGEKCMPNGENCQYACTPFSVNSTDGHCSLEYNNTAGTPCTSSTSCAYGLFCGQPEKGNVNGVCTAPGPSPTLGKSCISDDNCTAANAEKCACVEGSSTTVCIVAVRSALYSTSLLAAQNCAAEFGCVDEGLDFPCLFSNCPYLFCDYVAASANYTYTSAEAYCNQVYYQQEICSQLPPRPTPSPSSPTPSPSTPAPSTAPTTSPSPTPAPSSPTPSPTSSGPTLSPATSSSPILRVFRAFAFVSLFVLCY